MEMLSMPDSRQAFCGKRQDLPCACHTPSRESPASARRSGTDANLLRCARQTPSSERSFRNCETSALHRMAAPMSPRLQLWPKSVAAVFASWQRVSVPAGRAQPLPIVDQFRNSAALDTSHTETVSRCSRRNQVLAACCNSLLSQSGSCCMLHFTALHCSCY